MPHNECALIARSRAGDLGAPKGLVRLYRDRIYNLAYRITGNHPDAADAAQDAFVRALMALPDFCRARVRTLERQEV